MSALLIPQRELFINGNWVQPVRGMYLDVVNPATEGARMCCCGRAGAPGEQRQRRGNRLWNYPEHQQQVKQMLTTCVQGRRVLSLLRVAVLLLTVSCALPGSCVSSPLLSSHGCCCAQV